MLKKENWEGWAARLWGKGWHGRGCRKNGIPVRWAVFSAMLNMLLLFCRTEFGGPQRHDEAVGRVPPGNYKDGKRAFLWLRGWCSGVLEKTFLCREKQYFPGRSETACSNFGETRAERTFLQG